MMKAKLNKYSALAATVLVTLKSGAEGTDASKSPSSASRVVARIILSPKVASNPGVLDSRRLYALSQIETGGDDEEIGRSGEVSRYQIMPSIWRHYSDSQSYRDPETSTQVAQQHWIALYKAFKDQAHREPTDFDMYVLWNTGQSYYAKRGFKPENLNAIVSDRAQRYVNLVVLGTGGMATTR